jgi:hypothetical protein
MTGITLCIGKKLAIAGRYVPIPLQVIFEGNLVCPEITGDHQRDKIKSRFVGFNQGGHLISTGRLGSWSRHAVVFETNFA